MPQHTTMGAMGGSEAKWSSVLGYVSGILFLATFIALSLAPQYTAAQTAQALAEYDNSRTLIAVQNITFSLAVVTAIPFFLGLRTALRDRSPTWAGAGAALASAGFLIFVVLTLVQSAVFAALAGVYATGAADDKASAVVVARAVASLFNAGSVAFLAFAAGFIAFGLVMWNSRTFPNWVAAVGILTGIVALVSIAVPFGLGVLGLITGTITLVLFLAWLFGSAYFLSRTAPRPAGA